MRDFLGRVVWCTSLDGELFAVTRAGNIERVYDAQPVERLR